MPIENKTQLTKEEKLEMDLIYRELRIKQGLQQFIQKWLHSGTEDAASGGNSGRYRLSIFG